MSIREWCSSLVLGIGVVTVLWVDERRLKRFGFARV